MKLNIPKRDVPKLSEVIEFAQSYDVVGEETNLILVTLATLFKIPFGIISLSGSGKSVIADLIFENLLGESSVFEVPHTSATALINDYLNINTKKHLYIPELQKLTQSGPIAIELVKNVMEGKAYSRIKYDVTSDRNIVPTINPIHCAFTLALENRTKEDEEMSRRHFVIHTDISKGQTKRVIDLKCERRFKPSRLRKPEEILNKLKEYIRFVDDIPKKKYENPFAPYFKEIVEADYIRVRSMLDQYFDLMESSALWNYPKRIEYNNKVFLNLQDVYNVHMLYGAQFQRNILQIPLLGSVILRCFDDAKGIKRKQGQLIEYVDTTELERTRLSIPMIHRQLKKRKMIVKHNTIKAICDELCEGNYLEKERIGSLNFYSKIFEIEEFKDKLDFKRCWEVGCERMKKEYPKIYKKWLESNSQSQNIKLNHPVFNTTTTINLKDGSITVEKTPEEDTKIEEEYEEQVVSPSNPMVIEEIKVVSETKDKPLPEKETVPELIMDMKELPKDKQFQGRCKWCGDVDTMVAMYNNDSDAVDKKCLEVWKELHKEVKERENKDKK